MANNPRPVSATPLEADRMTPYLWFLFVLLSTATLFDGFDSGMLTFAAPESRRTLDIDLSEWGFVNSVIRLGVWASFFFLLLADRFGRRNLMMITVVGFGLFSGMTAFVTDKYQFVIGTVGVNQIPEIDPLGPVALIVAPDAFVDKIMKVEILKMLEFTFRRRKHFFTNPYMVIHRTADIEA